MCVVSMVGDGFRDKWEKKLPGDWLPTPGVYPPMPPIPSQPYTPQVNPFNVPTTITRKEFDALKSDIELIKILLIKAKIYDEQNGEPDCEMDEKIAFLKSVAKRVGVDLDEVFGK